MQASIVVVYVEEAANIFRQQDVVDNSSPFEPWQQTDLGFECLDYLLAYTLILWR
jgi:hypothetical protein